jgi:hypothetical protein
VGRGQSWALLNACGDNVYWPAPDWQAIGDAERVSAAQEQVRNRYFDRSFDPDLGRMIKDFVAYSTPRGIKVIGLLMPETREFREAANGYIDPAAERFAFSLGIPILDYRAAFEDRPDMFTDTDHLKDSAAATFSRRVAADIGRLIDVAVAPKWNCPAESLTSAGLGVSIRRLSWGGHTIDRLRGANCASARHEGVMLQPAGGSRFTRRAVACRDHEIASFIAE